jgi:hypothetical protein
LDPESEAFAVKSLLESAGIYAVLSGADVPIPSLTHKVQVAKDQAEDARKIIADARRDGALAAERGEAETESSS